MIAYTYKISHTPLMVRPIPNILNATNNDCYFEIDSKNGQGYVERHQLNDGLSIQISKFMLHEGISIERSGTTDDDLFILDFHIKGIGNLNLNALIDGFESINTFNNGIYFAHSSIQSTGKFEPYSFNEQLHLVIDKNWLFTEYTDQLKELLKRTNITGSFFVFERLTAAMVKVLIEITTSDSNSVFRKSYLKGKSLELLTLFFRAFQNRSVNNTVTPISSKDISRLFELESYIKANLNADLSVIKLARIASYSESKLQKLFKSVYGKSVHKKINEIKMIKALELLQTNNYSISQIGHEMGFHNMSHFSAAFKKIHGFLPSDY